MFNDIIKFGRELLIQGINNSHSGNVSARRNNTIYITRHGARLGDLSYQDFVPVNLKDDKKDKDASVEIKVHRAIYLANPEASAIIHCHPPHAIALSLTCDRIIPIDMEGKYYLPEIPVIDECVAETLPQILSKHKIAIVKGHGSFAIGKNFEEVYLNTSVCESISKIIVINKIVQMTTRLNDPPAGGVGQTNNSAAADKFVQTGPEEISG
ncbi:MAG: class II aldolase/adducin family protein [Elusimicrobia bacterium]|nr:class II aldolase/adducin family protein [Elusimicrobiota bacterium]